MKGRLIESLIITLISITLCMAIPYDCDKRNISCGCSFKNVEINEEKNGPEEAIPYSWSMMVSIRYDCNHNGDPLTHCCNGVILNDRYILTTARCFDSAENSSLLSRNSTIATSIHSLSQSCQTIRVVGQLFIHPDWTSSNETMHNLAILQLAEPLDFKTDFILSQTCLPSRMNTSVEIMDNTTLAVVRWGAFSNAGDNTDKVLQQLVVYPMDYNDSFCAGLIDDRKVLFCAERYGAPCFPEVGAPLFQWIGDRWELVGIESYTTDACSRIGYKGLFVRVAAYKDWIESIINSDSIPASSTESTTTDLISTTPVKTFLSYECNRTTACGCGYSDVVFRPTRIVGGQDAIDDSWSMIVSLRFYDTEEHFCAGTLLSNSFVLTAAHCVDQFPSTHPVNITITAGITSRSDPNGYQRNVNVIYIHPNYTAWPSFLNNIALLQLDRPLYFQNNPILAKTCVHRTNSSIFNDEQQSKNGTRLAVIGWGAMRPGSFSLSEYLKQIQVYAIDNQDQICENIISDSELQFCAGSYGGEEDACLGDSGGPILYWTGHYWEQVGIIGYNFYCGRPGYPGIYTRLSYYWEWMETILNAQKEYLEPQNPSPFPTTTTTNRPTVTRTTTQRTTSTTTTLSESTDTINSMQPLKTTATISPQTTTIISTPPMTMTNGTSQTATTSTPLATTTTNTPRIITTDTSLQMTAIGTSQIITTGTTQITNRTTQPMMMTADTSGITTTSMLPATTTTTTLRIIVTSISPQTTVTDTSQRTSIDTQPETTTTNTSRVTTAGTQPEVTVADTSKIAITSTPSETTTTGTSQITTTNTQPGTTTVNTSQTATTSSDLQTTTTISTEPITATTNTPQTAAATSIRETTIVINRSQTTATSTIPFSPRVTTTIIVPLKKETYECNRTLDQCGCSLTNVVLSGGNQQMSSTDRTSEDAFLYSWSMMVSVRVNSTKHTCTGTILSESFILTAAHCVSNQLNSTRIIVAAGILSLSQYVTSSRRVDQVYMHENYTAKIPHLHDIAILHLEQPLDFKTQPIFSTICLSNIQSFDSVGASLLVSVGWKHSKALETEDDNVQQVSLKSITTQNSTCFNSIYNDVYQFCAGLMANDTGTCDGNFGEPVFVYRDKYWEQVGILSNAYGCIPTGHSGIYTRLSVYINWIQGVMKDTMVPMRQPLRRNNASQLKQNMLMFTVLLFCIKIFY